MNSPDSLRLDDELARMLKAYDQGIGDPDCEAPTLNVQELPPEVRRMLEEDAELTPPPVEPQANATPIIELTSTPSHRVGRFELRRLLGRGGFGIVFLAFDPKLRREVALKIPRPEMLMSTEVRRRLFREAAAAAGFDHPNLVPVYETGEIGPVCFIATGYCPGETLAHWLDRQSFPVPVRQAARLVAILAEAVQHAHYRGVLHRDLKPNNILLQVVKTDPADQEPTPGSCVLRGERFLPRVVDFGLAKLAERAPSDTSTRQIVGTPKYMAPEQAQARQEDIGPTADVYALGVILYELLTGRAPYEGETDVEVLRQSIEGKLTPPRTLRPRIPRDLEAICLKAMARSPSRRYRTAVDLADDLRRFLTALPTIARPLRFRARALKWLRRNDQAVALGIVTFFALFFLVVGTWSGYESRRLKGDVDSALKQQETNRQQDRDRMYAQAVRSAYLYWRAGEKEEMAEALSDARRYASTAMSPTCFALEYLEHLRDHGTPPMVRERYSPLLAADIANGGQPLALAYADGSTEILDGTRNTTTPGRATKLRVTPGGILGIDFTPSRVVCRLVGNGRVLLDRAADPGSTFTAYDVADDGQRLIVGTDRGRATTFSLETRKEIETTSAEPGARMFSLALMNDGSWMAVREVNGSLGYRGPQGAGPLFKPYGKVNGALLVHCIPSSERIAIAGQGSAIRIHNLDGRLHTTLIGHIADVTGIAASPDGRVLASGSTSGEVKLWDLRTGQELVGLELHSGPVTVLEFSEDGRQLITGGAGSQGGEFAVWDAGVK